MSIAEEIDDLRALIAGLPAEMQHGPFAQVYRRRLTELLKEQRAPEAPDPLASRNG